MSNSDPHEPPTLRHTRIASLPAHVLATWRGRYVTVEGTDLQARAIINVARNLSRTPEKSSSLAFLERASNIKRGSVGSLQKGLQPAEQRRQDGKIPTTLSDTNDRKKRNRIVARATELHAGSRHDGSRRSLRWQLCGRP